MTKILNNSYIFSKIVYIGKGRSKLPKILSTWFVYAPVGDLSRTKIVKSQNNLNCCRIMNHSKSDKLRGFFATPCHVRLQYLSFIVCFKKVFTPHTGLKPQKIVRCSRLNFKEGPLKKLMNEMKF